MYQNFMEMFQCICIYTYIYVYIILNYVYIWSLCTWVGWKKFKFIHEQIDWRKYMMETRLRFGGKCYSSSNWITTAIRRIAVRETSVSQHHGDPVEVSSEIPQTSRQHDKRVGYVWAPLLLRWTFGRRTFGHLDCRAPGFFF